MAIDPILVADVVLDAALASHAEAVRIQPEGDRCTIAICRQGETLASSVIDKTLARHVIARLGYVCGVDPADHRAKTGRARVRSFDTQRDMIVTILPNDRAEVVFVSCENEAQEPAVGDRIGHYRVIAPLGSGGMGNVYEVVHERLGRRHALKVLQSWVLERDRASIERFLHEAQAAARIRNDHIVEIFDFGYLPNGRPYFVMELLGGSSLADLIDHAPVPAAHTVRIAYQLASALAAAHDRGVIHADVSPANILVSSGHVTLIDFGLAHLHQDVKSAAPATEVSGTPSYLAPERVRGYAPDEATDQYAFGIVLYEMLAGRPPFIGTLQQLCRAHLTQPPPPIASPYGPVSDSLQSIVMRCLAKDAAHRFSSMQDVADELVLVDEVMS